MKNQIVFCFSGQGSQYFRMGQELYEQDQTFKLWMNHLDEIARPLINQSIVSTLYSDQTNKSDAFNQTLLTHPAIFIFEYSLYCLMIEKKIYPDYVLGASLGEYVAAAASGILSYEQALQLVIKQARLIDQNCSPGAMLALLYETSNYETIKAQYPDIELAAINSDQHFIIGGPMSSLRAIEQELKKENIICQMLPVTHAFHSSLIDPASLPFLDYLQQFQFKQPVVPYLSCVHGTLIDQGEGFKNGYFWDVARQQISIKKAILTIEKKSPLIYLDLGPSGTFANLIKPNLQSLSQSKVLPFLSPFGNDCTNLKKVEKLLL